MDHSGGSSPSDRAGGGGGGGHPDPEIRGGWFQKNIFRSFGHQFCLESRVPGSPPLDPHLGQ